MSKEVSKKGMKDMVIGKFLERHNSEYEREGRFMLICSFLCCKLTTHSPIISR